MKKVLIYGCGGHGKVILDILLSIKKINIAGFIDDNPAETGKKINGYKVLGKLDDFAKKNNIYAVVLGIGNNRIREKIYNHAKKLNFQIMSATHSGAIVSKNVKIGEGVVVMPGAIINSGSILEDGVVINTGVTVDHDCYLERFCQIWPGANLAGSVTVGEFSYVGTGAAVIQNIKIGKNSIIGAGASVVKDIPDNVVAVGVPTRIVKVNKCKIQKK